jgi:hypothetical protein
MFNFHLHYYLQNKAESDAHYETRNPEIVKDPAAGEEPLASDTLSSDVRVEDNKEASPEPVELIESDEDEEEEGSRQCFVTIHFFYVLLVEYARCFIIV